MFEAGSLVQHSALIDVGSRKPHLKEQHSVLIDVGSRKFHWKYKHPFRCLLLAHSPSICPVSVKLSKLSFLVPNSLCSCSSQCPSVEPHCCYIHFYPDQLNDRSAFAIVQEDWYHIAIHYSFLCKHFISFSVYVNIYTILSIIFWICKRRT